MSGTVTDASGGPIANASVRFTGPASYTAATDSTGAFSIGTVTPGIYTVTIRKTGFQDASIDDFAILGGQPSKIAATLQAVTFASLREVAHVTARGHSIFNTSTASSQVVSAQTFADQGTVQVAHVLDQTPGIVIDHPGTNANNSSPGNITFPSVRGGLGFETASLIDGHPLAVGTYGDYVTTFLNSYFLQGAEVVKGPGAAAPEVNYAIGGTVNFRTKDPTRVPTSTLVLNASTNGELLENILTSGTTTNGKLGWVFGYGDDGQNGPMANQAQYWDVSRYVYANGLPLTQFFTNAAYNAKTNGIWNNPLYDNTTMLACCFNVAQVYNNRTELAKGVYKFSDATRFTASYLGSQTWTDQNGNHVYNYDQQFMPCYFNAGGVENACPSYSGTLQPGQRYDTFQSIFPPMGEWEVNNEPMFQGEFRTTFHNDTILARAYGASINRLQYNAMNSPSDSFSMENTLYGTYCKSGTSTSSACSAANLVTYNGTPTTLLFSGTPNGNNAYFYCLSNGSKPLNWSTNPYATKFSASPNCVYNSTTNALVSSAPGTAGTYTLANAGVFYNSYFFRSTEEDRIHGLSLQYDHPFGPSDTDLLTVSYDGNHFSTHSYSYAGDPSFAPSIPDGSHQTLGTLLVRGTFQLGEKWNAVIANYANTYNTVWSPDGGFNWNTTTFSHYDVRGGTTYRPNANISYRVSLGSAIAPPYLGLYSVASIPAPGSAATCGAPAAGACYTNKAPSSNIHPETSFGYDIGADYRWGNDQATTFSWDAYTTTLWNQYASSTYVSCQNYNPTSAACDATAATGDVPLITTGNINITNVRYRGVELALRHTPTVGWGYKAQGALLAAQPYNLPPCFYATLPASAYPGGVCPNPAGQTTNITNLGIIPGVNFYGSGTSGSGVGSGGFNAVNNHGIPYSQGYFEANYSFADGMYASWGGTLYGSHNSFNLPAFWISNATLRLPAFNKTQVQFSVDNIFNTYPNDYITAFGGIAVPLVNGYQGLTNANTYGPRNFRLILTRSF